MEYTVLTQDEQDDILVEFLQAQERDAYCHETNLERFTTMLETLPEGRWKDHIAQMKADTEMRLAEVNSIIAATRAQSSFPPPDRIAAAVARLQAKANSNRAV